MYDTPEIEGFLRGMIISRLTAVLGNVTKGRSFLDLPAMFNDISAAGKASIKDDFAAVERLTPEVCFPEAPHWPKSFFHAPWPLSEDFYLVGFSFDPLGGCSAGTNQDSETGLYYFDRFGNLVYRRTARNFNPEMATAAKVTIAEVEAVLSQPDIGDPLGIRDRAILELLYSTAIRRNWSRRLAAR